jgi:hypothetical protein
MISLIIESIIVGVVGAVVGLFVLWPKIKVELQKEYKSRINEQKWKAYSGFASYMGRLRDVPYDPSQFPKVISDLLLVANDRVIKVYGDYIRLKRDLKGKELSQDEIEKIDHSFMAILVEMRKDLDHEPANIDGLILLYSELGYYSLEELEQMKESLFFRHWLEEDIPDKMEYE